MFSDQKSPHLLVIDDEFGIREGLETGLRQLGFMATIVDSGEKGIQEFRRDRGFDLILCDYRMPGLNGFDVLSEIRKISVDVPFIMMTGHGSVHHAVEAMQHGASDYLCKPFSLADLERIVRKALNQENQDSGERAFLTKDPQMMMLMRKAERAAKSDVSMLIEGPSGTGKELLARLIHHWSPRRHKPWVAINCAALPPGLLESELFGFEKGAFTGAVDRRIGKFEQANGGTLLLDEIGELDPLLQAKLLRVLQEGEVDRLGGKRPIKVNVRIIASTNRNLEHLVKEDKFRDDLFFRLYGIRLVIPSLSDRPSDIEYLAQEFLKRQCKLLKQDIHFGSGVTDFLKSRAWPGNVRELERSIERAAIFAENGTIETEHFEFGSREAISPKEKRSAVAVSSTKSIKDMERETILQALEAHQGNRTHTARALGMSLRTLRHKLKLYREGGHTVETYRQNKIGKDYLDSAHDAQLVPLEPVARDGWKIADINIGEEYL